MNISPNQTTTCCSALEAKVIEPRLPITPPVVYGIDCDDRIIGVSRAWDRFAAANGAPEIAFASVRGRELWEFVCDASTAAIYRDVLGRVRDGATITLPLRCDSPSKRRWLTLTASPLARGGVRFTSRTIREQARPSVSLLEPAPARSSELIRLCSWCCKAQVPARGWVEVEEAVRLLDLFETPAVPRLTHGICPVCADAMLKLESDNLQSQFSAMV